SPHHGLPDRIEANRGVTGGCRLTSDPVVLVRGAGFALDDVAQRYGVGPKPRSWFTRGDPAAGVKPSGSAPRHRRVGRTGAPPPHRPSSDALLRHGGPWQGATVR